MLQVFLKNGDILWNKCLKAIGHLHEKFVYYVLLSETMGG